MLNTNIQIEGCKVLALPPSVLSHIPFKEDDTVIYFDSLDRFRGCMHRYTEFADCREKSSMRVEYSSEGFSGVKDWQGYLDILSNGNPEVISKMQKLTQTKLAELKDSCYQEIEQYAPEVTGSFFDVASVLENVPECWYELDDQTEEVKQVQLVVNMSASCGVSSSKIINNSARLLALAILLEEHDVLVSITLMDVTINHDVSREGHRLFVLCVLKDFDTKVDYVKCSALLNTSFLRRGTFKLMEIDARQNLACGYGQPVHNLEGVLDIVSNTNLNELETALISKHIG